MSGFIWSKTRGAQYRSNDEHSTNLLLTAIICQQSVINGHMLLCACYCRMNDTCSIGPARTTTPEGQHNNGRVSYSVIPLCPFHSIERFISRIVSYVLSKFTVLPFKEIIRKYDKFPFKEYEYSSIGGDEVAELKKIQSDVRTINEALTASIGRLLRREGDMETLERTAEKLSEKVKYLASSSLNVKN